MKLLCYVCIYSEKYSFFFFFVQVIQTRIVVYAYYHVMSIYLLFTKFFKCYGGV